jgi:GT2 family glycosyltransferase
MTKYSEFVIVVPVFGNFDLVQRCINSILSNTPAEVRIEIYDDASPMGSAENQISISGADERRVKFIRQEKNLGFVGNCNTAFENNPKCHVILVNSDVIVGHYWFEKLTEPLSTGFRVGTVTAMTNSGTLATAKFKNEHKIPKSQSEINELNTKLAQFPPKQLVEVPVGIGHCILITKDALRLCDGFSLEFSPGYGEEVDFSLRATKLGFSHFLANTYVYHLGGASFGKKKLAIQESHDLLIEKKFPGYFSYVQKWAEENEIYRTNIDRINILESGITVIVDARLMLDQPTGTGRLILNQIIGLADFDDLTIYCIVEPHLHSYWKDHLSNKIKIETMDSVCEKIENGILFDLLFVPNQVSNLENFLFLKSKTQRAIVQHLDFISYQNWTYFASAYDFYSYRRTTREVLDSSDGVVFISKYVQNLFNNLGLDNRRSSTTIYCGVDHFKHENILNFNQKENSILIYGAKFTHKNIDYFMKISIGYLKINPSTKFYIVGPNPAIGGSLQEISDFVKANHSKSIIIKEWVSDQELTNLIKRAKLVFYPTVSEGFGFVPFEAAAYGTPSIFNLGTSLSELFYGVPRSLIFDIETDLLSMDLLMKNENLWKQQLNFLVRANALLTWKRNALEIRNYFFDVFTQAKVGTFSSMQTRPRYPLKYMIIQHLGTLRIVLQILPIATRRREFVKSVVLKFL